MMVAYIIKWLCTVFCSKQWNDVILSQFLSYLTHRGIVLLVWQDHYRLDLSSLTAYINIVLGVVNCLTIHL